MAIRRRGRRSPRFTYGGKRGGRQYWWIRYTPFGLTLHQASTATHSDILLTQTDWENPTADLNSTQRGGARLERLIMDYGLAIEGNQGFFESATSANIALIPEFLLWKQSDQFATIVTSTSSFSATRTTHRVIMDEIPNMESFATFSGDPSRGFRCVRGRFETKSKVRLADSSLGIAWRGLFDTAAGGLQGYTDWVRPTMLISVP